MAGALPQASCSAVHVIWMRGQPRDKAGDRPLGVCLRCAQTTGVRCHGRIQLGPCSVPPLSGGLVLGLDFDVKNFGG